jgi:hypothetical protein
MRWAMSGNEAASMTTDCQPVQCLAYTLHPATAHPPDSSGVCRSTLAVSEFRLLLLEGRAWPKPSQTGEILGGREVRMTPVPSTTFVFGPLLAAQTPFWPLLAAQTAFWSAAAEPTGASTTMIYTQVLNRGRPESAAPRPDVPVVTSPASDVATTASARMLSCGVLQCIRPRAPRRTVQRHENSRRSHRVRLGQLGYTELWERFAEFKRDHVRRYNRYRQKETIMLWLRTVWLMVPRARHAMRRVPSRSIRDSCALVSPRCR